MIMWGNILQLAIIFGVPLILILAFYLENLRRTREAWKVFASKAGLSYLKDRNMVVGTYMGHVVDLSTYYLKWSTFTADPLYSSRSESNYQIYTKLTFHFNVPFSGKLKLRTRRNILIQPSRLINPDIKLGDPAFDQNFYVTSMDPYLPQYVIQPTARARFHRIKHWEFTWTLGKGHAVIMGRFKDPDALMEVLWALQEVTVAIEGVMVQQQQHSQQQQYPQPQYRQPPGVYQQRKHGRESTG